MEWISVKDRLPDKEMDLLVCTNTFYMGIGWYYVDAKKWVLTPSKTQPWELIAYSLAAWDLS